MSHVANYFIAPAVAAISHAQLLPDAAADFMYVTAGLWYCVQMYRAWAQHRSTRRETEAQDDTGNGDGSFGD